MAESSQIKLPKRIQRLLTANESVVWAGNPSLASFFPRYLSATILMLLCLGWGSTDLWIPVMKESPVVGQSLLGNLPDQLSFEGAMFGLLITGLIAIRLVYFNNGILHGRGTLLWMIATVASPAVYHFMHHGGTNIPIIGAQPDGPSMDFFFQAGVAFWIASLVSTRVYQKSFRYIVTDKRVHFNHRMLYLWSKIHTIDLLKVENVIVEHTLAGRIFGFGNLHLLTSSGIGIQSESYSVGVVAASGAGKKRSLPVRIASVLFMLMTHRRTRRKALPDPTSCLFGIRSPTRLHPVINDAIDKVTEARNAS